MKKVTFLLFLIIILSSFAEIQAQGYEYKVVTVVESIVPMGLGRSRIIENKQALEAKQFTTSRTDGKDSKQSDVDRSSLKLENFDETKLLNFYSAAGINFQNIASNDAIITSKINTLANEGWELTSTLSGVESDAGQQDGNGIYITRLIFRKQK